MVILQPIEAQVRAARAVVATGSLTVGELARYWGVDEAALRAGVLGETHADIAEPPPLPPSALLEAEPPPERVRRVKAKGKPKTAKRARGDKALVPEGPIPKTDHFRLRHGVVRTRGIIDPALAITPILDAKASPRCGVPGCGRAHAAYGYCHAHLKRVQRDGSAHPDIPIEQPRSNAGLICKVPGCATPINNDRGGYVEKGALGLCRAHYRALKRAEAQERKATRKVVFA